MHGWVFLVHVFVWKCLCLYAIGCIFFKQFLHLWGTYFFFFKQNLHSAISTLFLDLPSISPLNSCLSLKPCGTRPVYPSQEVWGRMAASWRQTAPKPCMLATPPSDTPALQWSPPDCPENQKHLPCLNDTQTYKTSTRTHAHMRLHTITHISLSCITHIHTHRKHPYILRYRHNEHTFLHTRRHKHTLRIIISRSCCHDFFYKRQVKYDCGVNSGGKKRQLWLSHLPAAFILLFSWEDTILISTNRRESQHRLTRNELWAVNVTTIPIMMMIVIKMMIAADSKRERKKRQPNNSVPALSSLDSVGQQAAPLDNALLRLQTLFSSSSSSWSTSS